MKESTLIDLAQHGLVVERCVKDISAVKHDREKSLATRINFENMLGTTRLLTYISEEDMGPVYEAILVALQKTRERHLNAANAIEREDLLDDAE